MIIGEIVSNQKPVKGKSPKNFNITHTLFYKLFERFTLDGNYLRYNMDEYDCYVLLAIIFYIFGWFRLLSFFF